VAFVKTPWKGSRKVVYTWSVETSVETPTIKGVLKVWGIITLVAFVLGGIGYIFVPPFDEEKAAEEAQKSIIAREREARKEVAEYFKISSETIFDPFERPANNFEYRVHLNSAFASAIESEFFEKGDDVRRRIFIEEWTRRTASRFNAQPSRFEEE
jgi:hypothetical protein